MALRPRIYYNAEQKAQMWDRWQKGESLKAIGRVFDRPSSSVFNQLSPSGGIRPPPRRRSRISLTPSEREEISRGIVCYLSVRSIASQLSRSPSTVSREINRNGGLKRYRASQADQAAWDRAQRPKPCKLAVNPALRRIVARKLRCNWSPEQIAGWLKRKHSGDKRKYVSHETIYRSLFVQARGVLKKELQLYLRTHRAIRRSKHATRKQSGLGEIKNMVSISERPASVEDRAVPGHWEGILSEARKTVTSRPWWNVIPVMS
jgi:IS30 family transposase